MTIRSCTNFALKIMKKTSSMQAKFFANLSLLFAGYIMENKIKTIKKLINEGGVASPRGSVLLPWFWSKMRKVIRNFVKSPLKGHFKTKN